MSTPAVRALAGVAHVLRSYEHDPAASSYGEEAAAALGVDAGWIYKTLVASVDGGLAVALVPVSRSLDLRALAAALGAKRAVLADLVAAERATGYVSGGISPLGQKRRLPTVLDVSALDLSTVFVSGGKRGLSVELAPGDLVRLTGARTAAITRPL